MAAVAVHDDGVVAAPSAAHARARAERTMLDVFLWMRLSHLGAGLVSLLVDRRRYRRPGLAVGAFAVVSAESVWLARRCRRTQSYSDPVVTTVDSAIGCAGLIACAAALNPGDQFGATNWMFPLTLFSTIGVSAGFPRRTSSVAAGTALMGTYALATTARTTDRRRQSLFGAFQYAGCFVGGDILIRRHRANADLIERTGLEAVERARSVAQARERARLSRDLHAGALATLEELRTSWSTDRTGARALARRESIRLRHAIRDRGAGTGAAGRDDEVPDLARRLEDVAREIAESGLRCELVFDALEHEPAPDHAAALADSVRAALHNAVVHAAVTSAVLRVAEVDGAVEVTVRDRGRGSDRLDCPASVAAPVRAAGGDAEWWSAPGRGARVVLRVGR